jgi:hypothetical protein
MMFRGVERLFAFYVQMGFRGCPKTLKGADFAGFSFQARKFTAGVPGHVKGK